MPFTGKAEDGWPGLLEKSRSVDSQVVGEVTDAQVPWFRMPHKRIM